MSNYIVGAPENNGTTNACGFTAGSPVSTGPQQSPPQFAGGLLGPAPMCPQVPPTAQPGGWAAAAQADPQVDRERLLLPFCLRCRTWWPFIYGAEFQLHGYLFQQPISIQIMYVASKYYREQQQPPPNAQAVLDCIDFERREGIFPPELDITAIREMVERAYAAELTGREAAQQALLECFQTQVLPGAIRNIQLLCEEPRCVHPANPAAIAKVMELLEKVRDGLIWNGAGENRWRKFSDWAQLRPQRELVRNVFVEAEPAVVGGPKGCLKTLLTLDMLISQATCTPWLFHPDFAVAEPLRVGFISCESSQHTLTRKHAVMLQRRLQTYPDRAPEIQRLDHENLFVDNMLIDLGTADGVDELVGRVQQAQLQVVALDPLHNFFGSMAKDAANTPALSGKIADISLRLAQEGCTLLMNAHPAGDRLRQQQNRTYQPLEVTDLAWPGVYNAVRQYALVSRMEPFNNDTRTSRLWLHIGGSSITEGGTFALTITEGRLHDMWECRVERAAAVIEDQRSARESTRQQVAREDEERIRDYLAEFQEGRTINAIMTDPNRPRAIGRDRLYRYLRGLETRHMVHRRQRRVGANTADVWFTGPSEEDRPSERSSPA